MTNQFPIARQHPTIYQCKLYALLQELQPPLKPDAFKCLEDQLKPLEEWWNAHRQIVTGIAQASDRLMFQSHQRNESAATEVRHLISGQQQEFSGTLPEVPVPETIRNHSDPQQVFLWLWRFYPDLQTQHQQAALLFPSSAVMPDCPQHSYVCTVSALSGVMYPDSWDEKHLPEKDNPQPYLLLFTFSPIQEFIKASRKFLDFWAGSYLLHYLSAYLCWEVAKLYGPDAIITPSLWGQEIIDALICQEQPDWKIYFACSQGQDPISRFNNRTSTSLSTAGFPNTITVLAAGKEAAVALGNDLAEKLKKRWCEIAAAVRDHVRSQVSDYVSKNLDNLWNEKFAKEFGEKQDNPYYKELEQYRQQCCWEWRSLWDAQIEHTWEPYYVVVPLGHPEADRPLQISKGESEFSADWIKDQNHIVRARQGQAGEYLFPSNAEKEMYSTLNVGTWWGSYQARLGQLIQAVKNTRSWQISVAPGERSSLSGQYSAVHPRFNYGKFQHGRGMSAGSMRLFWQVMAKAYPGLFNGSEKLNAIELTKRMAWMHGGVAQSIGVDIDPNDPYESLVRFPNLSSIAAARFAKDAPIQVDRYWQELRRIIYRDDRLSSETHERFCSLTRRPFHIYGADTALQQLPDFGQGYNGVMFSSRWLADDLDLKEGELAALRESVAQAHQAAGFGDTSPSDWWVLVLGDGDGMGKYVSGSKLESYEAYVRRDLLDCDASDDETWNDLLQKTKKRMGPATHVGLNRALLDFSNRLVPHLTERRCCGRVIYSGGDDVMVTLPLADLPLFLRSLRAAWSGQPDPKQQFRDDGGYWHPLKPIPEGIPDRPLFTMGKGATMSLGIVIAHKSVPLPTVLEKLWEAEKDRAKKMLGGRDATKQVAFPEKDGLCFRVIYSSGNTLEALMKGDLLESWWQWVSTYEQQANLSPLLYRLAEVLPSHADATPDTPPLSLVAKVVVESRDEQLSEGIKRALLDWINEWEVWSWTVQKTQQERLAVDEKSSSQEATEKAKKAIGTSPEELSNLLRFSAFWVSRRQQELSWMQSQPVATQGEQK